MKLENIFTGNCNLLVLDKFLPQLHSSDCYPRIDAPNRTTEDYERQVKDISYGIIGPLFLSEFLSIPDDVIIGDMHLIDELLNSF